MSEARFAGSNTLTDPSGANQYLRKWSVIVTSEAAVTGATGKGVVLSQSPPPPGFDLRTTFETHSSDGETPGYAIVTVYNLKPETSAGVVKEFDTLTLQAGYIKGHYGVIFKGQIKQYERGHETPTESFLKIFATDWDTGFSQSTINIALKAGWTYDQQQAAIDDRFKANGLLPGYRQPLHSGVVVHARTKLSFGMNMDEMADLSANNNQVYSVEDGRLHRLAVDRSTNKPLPPVILNAMSGLLGWPRVTDQGIMVRCLLNPGIKVAGLVKINNKDINQLNATGGGTFVGGGAGQVGSFPGRGPPINYALVTEDGMYRVMVREHRGDSRGEIWETELTCLAFDATAKVPAVSAPPRGSGEALLQAGGT